jgi:hypothetical protein
MKREQVNIGYIDVPLAYQNFNQEFKIKFCNNLIDNMLKMIENELQAAPEINRINFLQELLESSLITNENLENYEICSVLRDCINQINDC